MVDELKPCPFCGKLALKMWDNDEYNSGVVIGCENCQVVVYTVDAWNHRPTEAAAVAAERERVLKLVYRYIKYRHAGQKIKELIDAIESGEEPEVHND